MKTQSKAREKIFATHISVKGFISIIYKELKTQWLRNSGWKMKKKHEGTFHQREYSIQLAKKYMRWSPLLDIREMQIKTMIHYCFTPIRTTEMKIK